MMPTNDNETNKVIDELNEEIDIREKHISHLQKKCDKWKACWESAEKRCGELERNLKSLRELQELEIGEREEREKKTVEILKDIPSAPTKHSATELMSEWMDGYVAWYKRWMEHLSDEV